MRIGVMSLQGDFAEHLQILHQLKVEGVEIRLPCELESVDGLIIPGGESTTISKLMRSFEIMQPIRERARAGLPIMGTCAGMILMAKKNSDPTLETLQILDIEVKRNAFGRQVDSFEVDLPVPILGKKPFHAVFIRAPKISRAGQDVQIIAKLEDGSPIAVRQGNLLACSFHPELTSDTRFHKHFLAMCTHGQKTPNSRHQNTNEVK